MIFLVWGRQGQGQKLTAREGGPESPGLALEGVVTPLDGLCLERQRAGPGDNHHGGLREHRDQRPDLLREGGGRAHATTLRADGPRARVSGQPALLGVEVRMARRWRQPKAW